MLTSKQQHRFGFTSLPTTCASAWSVILYNQGRAPRNYHVAQHQRNRREVCAMVWLMLPVQPQLWLKSLHPATITMWIMQYREGYECIEGFVCFLHPGFHSMMWFLLLGGVYLWGSCSLTLPAVLGSSECGQSAHLPANQQTTAQSLETGAENCFSWPNTFQFICVKNKQTKKAYLILCFHT